MLELWPELSNLLTGKLNLLFMRFIGPILCASQVVRRPWRIAPGIGLCPVLVKGLISILLFVSCIQLLIWILDWRWLYRIYFLITRRALDLVLLSSFPSEGGLSGCVILSTTTTGRHQTRLFNCRITGRWNRIFRLGVSLWFGASRAHSSTPIARMLLKCTYRINYVVPIPCAASLPSFASSWSLLQVLYLIVFTISCLIFLNISLVIFLSRKPI